MSLQQNIVSNDYPSTDKEDEDFIDGSIRSESDDETFDDSSEEASDPSDDDLVPSTPSRGQHGLTFRFSHHYTENKELTSYLSCRWSF